MTFRSLYRLEGGLLDCPIVGVAVDDGGRPARDRARESIVGTGETLDKDVFDRFAASLLREGDFGDAATYERVAEAIKGAEKPVFYLEIPPFLFGRVVKGLAEAGLTKNARVVVEKPFGHDRHPPASWPTSSTSTSTSRSSTGSTTTSARWASRRSSTSGSRTRCWSRSGAGTTSSRVEITMAEDFGVEDRGHFYDPVGALRDVVVNHLMQVVAAAAMEAPPARPANDQGCPGALFRAVAEADPAHYVRGQYDGYLDIDGVAPNSTTETYAALRLDIENWRWAGVPFFIRTGKRLAGHPDRAPARLQARRRSWDSTSAARRPEPNQLVVKLDPSTGIRLDASSASRRPARRPSDHARHGVRRAGRRGPDAVRGAPARGDGRRQHPIHPSGRCRGAVADHAAAARRATAGALLRAGVLGARGGRRPRRRPRPLARTVDDVSERDDRAASPDAAERRRALAVPAHRRLRVPLQLPHGCARRPRRRRRLALRPVLRLAERLRQPARPEAGCSGSGRSASTIRPRACTSPARTCS